MYKHLLVEYNIYNVQASTIETQEKGVKYVQT